MRTHKKPRVAVVVTTYNRPTALAWTLAALAQQSVPPEQVVVADDGSGSQTQQVVQAWQSYYQAHLPQTQLHHVWQPDQGFRAAAARNLGVQQAVNHGQPDLLIFLDGDCIAPKGFVAHHLRLRQAGLMVAGGRGLLSPAYTEQLERQVLTDSEASTPADSVSVWRERLQVFDSPYWLWLTKRCDRFWPMLSLTSSIWQPLRDARPRDESLVRTCNLSLSRQDFERVGGFDESFVGWGLEDTDLALRLMAQGVRVRSGRFATNVYHLWHAERSRDQLQANAVRLENTRTAAQ